MRSFVKIKSMRNGKTTLSFTDKVNHAILNVANMSFNAIHENKILEFEIYSNPDLSSFENTADGCRSDSF